MARVHIRPRSGYNESADLSLDSTVSESVPPTKKSIQFTVDTSSLTNSDISKLDLPDLPAKDELALLRQRVKIHEKREEQLMNDIVQIQDKLEFSKKNTNRWKRAVHEDVRSGSHYRKEIVLLKQELDSKDDYIRDREITIENLLANNHPSHSFLVGHSVSQQTPVCSSLLDESFTGSQRELERSLSEKSSYMHKLRQKDEEVHRLRKKLTELEKERIDMKKKIDVYEMEGTRATNTTFSPSSQPSVEKEEVKQTFEYKTTSLQPETSSKCRTKKSPSTVEENKLLNSFSSVTFNPFQLTDGQPSNTPHLQSAYNLQDYSDSIRTMKSVMELQKELNKTKKERDSLRDELEQGRSEAKQLRRALDDTRLQTMKNSDMFVSKSDQIEQVQYDCNASTSAFKHYEAKIRKMNAIIGRQKTEVTKRDSIIFELEQMPQFQQDNDSNLPIQRREIIDLKEALDESLTELESAAEVMTEQRQTIQDMKKTLSVKEDNYLQLQNYLKVENESLEIAKRTLMEKDSEVEELSLTVKKFESLEKNFILRDNEIKDLQQAIVLWEDRCDRLREELVKKETEEDFVKQSSEKATVKSYESQIIMLNMKKDATISALRKDLSSLRSRSAEEVAHLADKLSKMREENIHLKEMYNPDTMQRKDKRIHTLERTLHAQEETLDHLRLELGQVQLSAQHVSEQRRKDLEELQKELIESKSAATNQDREYTHLKVKLNECKIEYEKETKSLRKEIERLKKESSRQQQDTNIMLEAKQRLEQLKFVNFELKEDNVKLNSNLERALSKIEDIGAENKLVVELEKECATLKKKLGDLESLFDKNEYATDQKSGVTDNGSNQGKGKRTEKGKRMRLKGWGKSVLP